MKNVIITGFEGFIGSQLYKKLLGLNYKCVGVSESYLNEDNWESILDNIFLTCKPDVVFHLGACANTLEKDVNFMMIRNYESTKKISNLCSTYNIPLIYSSSAANYGVNGRNPSNLYGWSKYVSEDYVIGKGGIALRYFNVYGPGEERKGTMASFINQAFNTNAKKEKVFIFPNNPRRDFVHVDDVVSANIFAFENYKNLDKKYYEVSTGVANFFEYLLERFRIKYEYLPETIIPNGYQFNTCGDKSKWMDGWKPMLSLDAGLDSYKDYLENSLPLC